MVVHFILILRVALRQIAGFIPINTWQQRASLPFKPASGHRLQVKTASLMFMDIWQKYVNCHNKRSFITPDRRQSKTLWTIAERGSQIARNCVFDCHLSPIRRQTAIENSASKDFWSSFVGRTYVFDCRLSDVSIDKQELGVIYTFHVSGWKNNVIVSLYVSWCYGGHFCIQLNKII